MKKYPKQVFIKWQNDANCEYLLSCASIDEFNPGDRVGCYRLVSEGVVRQEARWYQPTTVAKKKR